MSINKEQQHNQLCGTGSKLSWVPLQGLGVPWVLRGCGEPHDATESNLPLILIDSSLIFTRCIIHAVSNIVTLDMTLHCVFANSY